MLFACNDAVLQDTFATAWGFLESNDFVAVLAITLGCLTGMVAIIAGVINRSVRTRAMEQTKRELAAYVAEGSLDPDQAVAMINAGRPRWETGHKA